ncbi:MAG: hypothetical protein ACLQIB_18650 [Isosphaeraceae bacterium]
MSPPWRQPSPRFGWWRRWRSAWHAACLAVFVTGANVLALTLCGVVYFVQDVSYDLIRLLAWVGLVHQVRKAPTDNCGRSRLRVLPQNHFRRSSYVDD